MKFEQELRMFKFFQHSKFHYHSIEELPVEKPPPWI